VAIVTGHRTQLTIAITDRATTIKMGVQNNVANKATIIFWFVHPIVTFWGTLVANDINKFFSNEFVGGKTAAGGGQLPMFPFLATSLHAHAITTAIRKQSTEKNCTQHTLAEQMLTADPSPEVLILDSKQYSHFCCCFI